MDKCELKTFLGRKPLVSYKPFGDKVMCVIADKPSHLAFVRTAATPEAAFQAAAEAWNRKVGSIANA